ncbi:MAG: DUF2997 domain-containing protein [Planctomycetaceae bacterium]
MEITFLPNGQSRVETKGFIGTECREASRFLEQALGQSTQEILKPEFHQTASSSTQLQQGQ